jgi:uncharacterized protein YbjT (DUF2867 family)
MAEKKIIVVTGATGNQGGGLVRAILANPASDLRPRAITRSANSPAAKALAELGAEVVEADLNDLESVKRAFDGAYGAFCVTFFWEDLSPENELAHAKTMAIAAKHAGLEHVVWSTLEDTRTRVPLADDRMPTLMGRYKVPHLDAKAEANGAFIEAGVPTTFLVTSFFWENNINFGMGPKPGRDGILTITFPMGDKKLPGIAAEDIGKCAYGLFNRRDSSIGATVGIAGEHLTGAQMAAALSEAFDREVRYNDISPEAYRGLGFPGADDLGNMFQYFRDFEADVLAARSIETSRALNPALQSFKDWLAKNKHNIPLDKT